MSAKTVISKFWQNFGEHSRDILSGPEEAEYWQIFVKICDFKISPKLPHLHTYIQLIILYISDAVDPVLNREIEQKLKKPNRRFLKKGTIFGFGEHNHL